VKTASEENGSRRPWYPSRLALSGESMGPHGIQQGVAFDLQGTQVPTGDGPYGSMAMMRYSERGAYFWHRSPARAVRIGNRRSDDLASAGRTWLSDLQGHSHAMTSYHCRTVISHLDLLLFYMPLPGLRNASKLEATYRPARVCRG
jgi:hypothetical protein